MLIKSSTKVTFDKAKRFNNSSLKGISGAIGPGPAYFVTKYDEVDSTKKKAERAIFPT